jgi:hypothetical protein
LKEREWVTIRLTHIATADRQLKCDHARMARTRTACKQNIDGMISYEDSEVASHVVRSQNEKITCTQTKLLK